MSSSDDKTQHTLPGIVLKKREDRRIRKGHPWVFSNEVDVARSPLSQFEAGESVELQAADGTTLGSGYVNPHSLIAIRLLGRSANHRLNYTLIKRRLGQALALRERLFAVPFYRLVYGEADALPGLVIDRFGDVVVVQIGTAGMDVVTDKVVKAIDELLSPKAIVLRNDIASRALEGLEQYTQVVSGTLPDCVLIEENAKQFKIYPAEGQKTGWFFDQRVNREMLGRYSSGLRVLDLFSYTGGFGVSAATGGAASVVCVDASGTALSNLTENAALNGVESKIETIEGDVFQVLKDMRASARKFDLVVVDPPAFIPRRKDREAGQQAYYRLNRAAIALLDADGFLFSASCSYHLEAQRLRETVYNAARSEGRRTQFLASGHQGPDHPIHPAMPESEYLKLFVARAISG